MPKLISDEKWKKFNEKLEKLMKGGDFFGLGATYYEMADFVKGEGKDEGQFRELGYQMKLHCTDTELSRYKVSGVIKEVSILCTGDSCNFCKTLNGKSFSITQAILDKPIPVRRCTHKYGCRCCYIPEPTLSEAGRF